MLTPQTNQNNTVWAIREDLLATNEPLNDIHQALLNREAEVHKDSEVVVTGSTEEKQRAAELLSTSTALRDRLANTALPASPTETLNNTKANLDGQATQFAQDLNAIVARAQEAINALSSLPEINMPPSSAAVAELEEKIQQAKACDKFLHEAILAIESSIGLNFSSLSLPNNPYDREVGPGDRPPELADNLDDEHYELFMAMAAERLSKKKEAWDKLKPLWDATGR